MSNVRFELIRWSQYILTLLFLLQLVIACFIIWDFAYVTNFIILFAISLVVGLLFHKFTKDKLTRPAILLMVVVFFVISLLLNISVFMSLVFACLLSWRLLTHLQEADTHNESNILLYSILTGFLGSIVFANFRFSEYFLILTGLQIFIFIWIRAIRNERIFKTGEYQKWSLGIIGLLIIGVAFLTLVFTFLADKLINGIAWVFGGIFTLLATPLIYAMNYILNLFFSRETEPIQPKVTIEGKPEEPKAADWITQYSDIPWIYFIIGIFILYAFYRFFYKTTRKERNTASNEVDVELSKVQSHEMKKPSFFSRFKSPNDPVRKRFYQFQRKMQKYGLGRVYPETVEDWLQRLNISYQNQQLIADYYSAVRYGNRQLSQNEIDSFISTLKEITKEIKERQ